MSKAVCIIVENGCVPPDTRVWREAVTLAEAGYGVSVICPKRPGFERSYEVLKGVEIYRHDSLDASRPLGYLFEYAWAFLIELLLAVRIYARTRFSVLQACNPPDTIFLIALFFRFLGVRFVFDQHDPTPEFYEARFQRRDFLYQVIRIAERLTFNAADVTIVTNESCREIALTRGSVPEDRCFVVRSCPDLDEVRSGVPRPELRGDKELLVVYVGIMGPQDGLNLLLQSIHHIVKVVGKTNVQFALVGPGSEVEHLKTKAAQLGIESWVNFTGPLYGEPLYSYFASADIGVSPDPANAFNDKLTMVKILEYMAYGLPVVLYDLQEGRRSAEGAALFAKPNEPIDFAQKIVRLMDAEPLRKELGSVGKRRVETTLNWEIEKRTYLRAYETAFGGRAPKRPRAGKKNLKTAATPAAGALFVSNPSDSRETVSN